MVELATMLPKRKDLFIAILSDAIGRDENPEVFDATIEYANREYPYEDGFFDLETIVEEEDSIKENLYGYYQGYLKA